MSDEIKALLNDNDEAINNAASIVMEAKLGYENGEITVDQFKELALDAIEIEKIGEMTNDLDRKIKIQKAFEMLKSIISAVA